MPVVSPWFKVGVHEHQGRQVPSVRIYHWWYNKFVGLDRDAAAEHALLEHMKWESDAYFSEHDAASDSADFTHPLKVEALTLG